MICVNCVTLARKGKFSETKDPHCFGAYEDADSPRVLQWSTFRQIAVINHKDSPSTLNRFASSIQKGMGI
ncbi:hypothetical protein AAC387_Pa08g0068 [Persea americana]